MIGNRLNQFRRWVVPSSADRREPIATASSDHPEACRGEMAIERDANPPLSHQHETQGVDRREHVQVWAFEIFQACSRSRDVQGNTRSLGTTF